MLSSFPICLLLARRPFDGKPPVKSFGDEFRKASCRDIVMPALGGLMWTVGTTLNFVCGKKVSQAVAYSIAQAAPMIAALWGVIYFREFKGAPAASYILLSAMFASYAGAIVSIALASGKV